MHNVRRITVCLLLAGALLLVCRQASAQTPEPLREGQIVTALKSGGITQPRLVTLVNQRGVDFALTPKAEQRLRAAGAGDELIAAIRKAKVKAAAKPAQPAPTSEPPSRDRVPATAARAPATEAAPKPPLTETDILKGLAGRAGSRSLAIQVGERGVEFALTPESEQRLRALGANDELIAAIRRAKPASETPAQATAVPAPSTLPRQGGTKVNPKDGLTYVWIPPGTFQMGCSPGDRECEDNEKPAHVVTITRGFWMGQTEVTQAAYLRVVGANPSTFHGDRLPVEKVNWDEARSYCGAVGMRLPTEAEWEYAARAGSTAARYGDLDAVAWNPENSGSKTHEVAQKQPNAWQLHDMLGNVYEWVADWYGLFYYRESRTQDPQGPSTGQDRVLRGGSWRNVPRFVRVSYRDWSVLAFRLSDVGFRCAGEVF